MKIYCFAVVLFAMLVSAAFAQVEPGYQPMVAFMCGYSARYLTENGWMKDNDTDCVDDVEDVLDFCRKNFPNLDVRNVVENNQEHMIDSWCMVGEANCDRTFTVRPYRCLVGPFQSDALLVPAGCVFDHVHRSHVCKSYSEWNATAVQSCIMQNRAAHSFAVLQPCEGTVSQFDGVEFVCCPKDYDLTISSERLMPVPSVRTVPPAIEVQEAVQPDTSSDFYRYMHNNNTLSQLSEEHTEYVAAKADLRKQHRAARDMLAEDWSRVRQRVEQLNTTDQLSAEKLDKDTTSRFQKAVAELDIDDRADRLKLDAKHQQRVESFLNRQKLRTLQAYHEAVAEQKQDTEKVLRTLKQYIKTEQKDRQHIANRYHHLLQTDPELLASEKHTLASRLRTISSELQQAVDLLNQVTHDEQRLRNEIDNFMATFNQLDRSASLILNDDEVVNPVEDSGVQLQQVDSDAADKHDVDTNVDEDEQQSDLPESKTEVQNDKQVQGDGVNVKQQGTVPASEVNGDIRDEADDDSDDSDGVEQDDNDHSMPQIKHSDHLSDSVLDQDEVKPIMKLHYAGHAKSTGLVVMAVGGCVLLIGLIVASVFILQRRGCQPGPHGPAFSSLSQSIPPEDIHITSMQMTGYENPTYRFFEEKGSCKA
jgi:amyloid beta A4 protein